MAMSGSFVLNTTTLRLFADGHIASSHGARSSPLYHVPPLRRAYVMRLYSRAQHIQNEDAGIVKTSDLPPRSALLRLRVSACAN